MIDRSKVFLIVGLGLIGGSYAMSLTRQGYAVYAIDTDPNSIRYAVENGLVKAGATDVAEALEKNLLGNADVVVFGLYPNTMLQWIQTNQRHFKPGAILTDVSGVKCNVIDVIQQGLRQDVEFIGCHPMAGKEVSGVQNSSEDIFPAANFIVTPTPQNSQEAVDFAKDLGKLLGFHTVSELDPQSHDEMIGFLSQLTHAIAVSLMTCNDDKDLQKYTGDSFRDLTRIARINEKLWTELFFLNKDILIRDIDAFSAELQRLKHMLQQGDRSGLNAMFIKSTARRKEFDRH